ncbi:MAG: hypothetical protein AB1801_04355 [Chloroflexota bacterium]
MEISTEKLQPIRIKGIADIPHLAWAEGNQFCLPHSTLVKSRLLEQLDSQGNLLLSARNYQVDPQEAATLRLRAAFTNQKPVSTRLPVSYYRAVPPWLRSVLATTYGHWQRRRVNQWAAFPRWPLDLSADFLADLAQAEPALLVAGPTPVVLTHDLDSAEGLENLVKWFLPLEEAVGACSTNFIVPCAWPLDHGLLAQVRARGHEIGTHGYNHANYTPFLAAAQRRKRLGAARDLIERYDIIGYRSPSLLRTRDFFPDLAQFYRYDSSIPTSGGLFPTPNNGCASARPFYLEGLVEIPISLPRDGSLRFLGYSPQEIANLWIQCAEQISQSGGMVVLLTHCEARFSGHPAMRQAYLRFLKYVAGSDRYIWRTLKEIYHQVVEPNKV